MAYIEKDFIAVNHIEREFYFQGEYGAKGEKREKKKHSSLEIKEYNHKQQEHALNLLFLSGAVTQMVSLSDAHLSSLSNARKAAISACSLLSNTALAKAESMAYFQPPPFLILYSTST